MKLVLNHVIEALNTGTITTAGTTTITINGGAITNPSAVTLSVGYWSGMTVSDYIGRVVTQLLNCPDVFSVVVHDTGTAKLIYVARIVDVPERSELVPSNLALALGSTQISLALKLSAFGRYAIEAKPDENEKYVWGLGGAALGLLIGGK